MRIVMMGTGPFAVPTFRSLLHSPHQVAGLVTQPERAKQPKSGRQPPPSPMRQVAEEVGLEIYDPADINSDEGGQLLRELNPQLLVVCDYGQILKPAALASAAQGGINLHGSLLPKYRGAAPVNWAIIRGETETGVTVIHMTPGLDAGPILARRRTPIDPNETVVELEHRLSELGVAAVQEAIELLEKWDGTTPLGEPQNAADATRARRLTKADALLNWNWPGEVIHNRIRGLVPWPGTFTHWLNERGDEQRLIIHRSVLDPATNKTGAPGEIVTAGNEGLQVMAGDGVPLWLTVVQPAGKKILSGSEFVRGYRLQCGMKFL